MSLFQYLEVISPHSGYPQVSNADKAVVGAYDRPGRSKRPVRAGQTTATVGLTAADAL